MALPMWTLVVCALCAATFAEGDRVGDWASATAPALTGCVLCLQWSNSHHWSWWKRWREVCVKCPLCVFVPTGSSNLWEAEIPNHGPTALIRL